MGRWAARREYKRRIKAAEKEAKMKEKEALKVRSLSLGIEPLRVASPTSAFVGTVALELAEAMSVPAHRTVRRAHTWLRPACVRMHRASCMQECRW